LIEVGTLELNQNPENYFQDVEQAAFAPAHVVDGISYSPDKMLQGRLLAYQDAQRYRLGTNYEQIQVNRCPFAVNNHQRDGQMRMDGNGGRSKNYYPSSFDSNKVEASYAEPSWDVNARIGDYYDRNADGESDHYSQAGNLFDLMSEQERNNTIENIVNAMYGIDGSKRMEIINRQLCHWFRVRSDLGVGVAKGLGVRNEDEVLPSIKFAFV
jgi:catalase